MNKRLKENLQSEYFAAANRLQSKKQRRKIVAYVEAYDDIIFWRNVLSRYENEQRYFEIMLPSKKRLTKGKKSVLMNLLTERAGKDMIACVDADYDWLMQGITPISKNILSNPYVFHTYVYAIENFQCYAPSLHNVAVMATLNDRTVFDFVDFFQRFSQAIFPLFVWNIWHYRQNRYSEFTMSDFNHIIETGHLNIHNPDAVIAKVKYKVFRKVKSLQDKNPDAKDSYLALKRELLDMGITPDMTYLYIQGHHLFDNVVVPLLKQVCNKLRQERENEINRNAVHNIQRHNELTSYTRSIEEVTPLLRRNTGYEDCPPYQWLHNDLQHFLANDAEKHQEAALSTTASPAAVPHPSAAR